MCKTEVAFHVFPKLSRMLAAVTLPGRHDVRSGHLNYFAALPVSISHWAIGDKADFPWERNPKCSVTFPMCQTSGR